MEKSSFISSARSSTNRSSMRGNTPEKAEISFNTQQLILKLHRDFTAQQDDRQLHSITPASSINLDSSKEEEETEISLEHTPIRQARKGPIFESRSSFSSLHSDDFIFHPEEMSLTDLDDKIKSNWS